MQNVVKKTVTQQSRGGASMVEHESTTDTPTQTIANIIYFIAGIFELALAFRFVFKITGANPSGGFVSGVYSFTNLLVLPFTGIFSSAVTEGVEVRAVFEPATMIALLVYAVLAWGLVRLIAIAAGHSNEEL